jgi:hypothetical protein
VSGATVTCKRGSTTVWTNTAQKYADTAQYIYTGTPTVSGSGGTVYGDKSFTATGTITKTLQTYTVARNAPANALGCYVSSDASATSAAPASYAYSYGTTVYLFAVYPIKYYNYYTAPKE